MVLKARLCILYGVRCSNGTRVAVFENFWQIRWPTVNGNFEARGWAIVEMNFCACVSGGLGLYVSGFVHVEL